ncbi:MAG: alpha/beta fold hydrolase [Bryobacteraceae bacterium]|jgi:dienelactone hydrolase
MTPSKPGSPQRVPVFFIIACALSALANAGARVKIDEYDPPEPNSNGAAVILLYGSGGLRSPAFNYPDEARQIARMGYPVYLPHYLDATHGSANDPQSHYETWANTQQYTLSRIFERQQYTVSRKGLEGVPQSRIAIVGYSLGGSVALAFASKEPHLAGVVVWSGSMPDAYRDVENLPPLLILHGARDSVIPASNARQLAALCAMKHFRCDFSIYPGEGHAFSADGITRANHQIQAFLQTVLQPR